MQLIFAIARVAPVLCNRPLITRPGGSSLRVCVAPLWLSVGAPRTIATAQPPAASPHGIRIGAGAWRSRAPCGGRCIRPPHVHTKNHADYLEYIMYKIYRRNAKYMNYKYKLSLSLFLSCFTNLKYLLFLRFFFEDFVLYEYGCVTERLGINNGSVVKISKYSGLTGPTCDTLN